MCHFQNSGRWGRGRALDPLISCSQAVVSAKQKTTSWSEIPGWGIACLQHVRDVRRTDELCHGPLCLLSRVQLCTACVEFCNEFLIYLNDRAPASSVCIILRWKRTATRHGASCYASSCLGVMSESIWNGLSFSCCLHKLIEIFLLFCD